MFVDFQEDFGGVSYAIPGDVVSLGLWRYAGAGGMTEPHGGVEDGLFWGACGEFKYGQEDLSLRQDGVILEADNIVASSVERFIENHALFSWVHDRSLGLGRRRWILSRCRGEDVRAELGLSPVVDAMDAPFFSWWEGGDVFVREGLYWSVGGRRVVLQVFSGSGNVFERVGRVVADAVVSEWE
ncbi:hypothetical protein LY474_19730 [Myxococcus stipitatus]|uniref:hypothetical protein n=1 Tax=Myxococcus stipitatus TaxID=83455 RepID=UPI001F3C899C|nr:hypothetical protein [Myxococcus stipitatus]MCE9670033.1 hypothetical protein [Myxococcus stipitatus]